MLEKSETSAKQTFFILYWFIVMWPQCHVLSNENAQEGVYIYTENNFV